jgi:hypothetical protein
MGLWGDGGIFNKVLSTPERTETPLTVELMTRGLQHYLGGGELCKVTVEGEVLSGEPMLIILFYWEGKRFYWKARIDDESELLDWELMKAFADKAQDKFQRRLEGL